MPLQYVEKIFQFIAFLFAISIHESAHAWMANRRGDPTARMLGRISLNPIKHIDPLGTIVLPGILLLMKSLSGTGFIFGWAKPVPVNFFRLRNPKRDMVWVAAAGPAVNVVLAFISALLIHTVVDMPGFFAVWFQENLLNSIYINVLLAQQILAYGQCLPRHLFSLGQFSFFDGFRRTRALAQQHYRQEIE